jgi:hypothetical protein
VAALALPVARPQNFNCTITGEEVSEKAMNQGIFTVALINHQTYNQKLHRGGFVYVIYRQLEEGSRAPLYVGESTQPYKRMDDYARHDFMAATDFKVGVAIQYLRARDYRVFVEIEEVEDRYAAECGKIDAFKRQGVRILNDLRGYNYRTADPVEEQRRVEEFVAGLITTGEEVCTS